MEDLRRRIERVEEAVAFIERAQDETAAHALDVLRRVERLTHRLDALERRLTERARPETPDGGDPAGSHGDPDDARDPLSPA